MPRIPGEHSVLVYSWQAFLGPAEEAQPALSGGGDRLVHVQCYTSSLLGQLSICMTVGQISI